MNVNGGVTVSVYRGAPDRFGDRDGALIGTIDHCLLDQRTGIGDQYHAGGAFSDTAVTTGVLVWCPTTADIKLQNRDRIIIDGLHYNCIGNRLWDGPSPITGMRFSHYAIQVEAAL
jgi:hypothetical protein